MHNLKVYLWKIIILIPIKKYSTKYNFKESFNIGFDSKSVDINVTLIIFENVAEYHSDRLISNISKMKMKISLIIS